MFVFKVLDVNNDKRISESDLFNVMRMCNIASNWNSSDTQSVDKKSKQIQRVHEPLEHDMFLYLFAGDFCKIIKALNLKRKVRGKEDYYYNKYK